MKTPMLLRWLVCLCLLPSLASCGLFARRPAPAPLVRTEVLSVPTIAYRPLPSALTVQLLPPPPPPLLCELDGTAAVCVLDALATIPAWDAALQACNADRRKAAVLGAANGQ